MSSPRLNDTIIVGCIAMYLSVFLFGLDGKLLSSFQYSVNCQVKQKFSFLYFHLYRVIHEGTQLDIRYLGRNQTSFCNVFSLFRFTPKISGLSRRFFARNNQRWFYNQFVVDKYYLVHDLTCISTVLGLFV